MTLLEQIQQGAIDSKVDLSETLRRCKLLAARLKNQEFAEWVGKELDGYDESATLPAYRTAQTHSLGHFQGPFGSSMRDAIIPPSSIPDDLKHHVSDLRFCESVGQLLDVYENMLKNGGSGSMSWNPDLIAHIQHERIRIYSHEMVLQAAYKVVPSVVVKGILDTVRTRILDFVLAIEDIDPAAGEASPTAPPPIAPEKVQHVYNTTIINGQANIGTQGNATITTGAVTTYNGVRQEDRAEVQQLVTKLKQEIVDGEFEDEDREEANEALAKLETQLAKDKPDGGRIKRYLTLVATLITSAAPTVNALISLLQRLNLF